MLISLSPFGNLSRFVRQGNRVHETVLLLIDGDSIPCSGTILAARSSVFETLVRENYEVHLLGFNGMAHQISQCLELMYGGQIMLDSSNIQAFLNFSVQFEINELINLCAVWMENNNLYLESEKILNEQDRSKCIDMISCINFKKISENKNSMMNQSISSDEEEYIDLEEICSSFTDTTIETHHTNGHTSTIVSSKGRGRLAAELSSLASPSSTATVTTVPASTNSHDTDSQQTEPSPGSNIRDGPGEWQKVPVPQTKIKTELILKNPVTQYKPNLAKWPHFSPEDFLRLGSPLCPYPEFAKLEVGIAWLANSELNIPQCQNLMDQFMANIDPLDLSDRYISLLNDYMNSWNVSFPPHFKKHIKNCYVPDDPASDSKYFMHLWTLQKGDLAELRSFNFVSFFATCPLCDKGTGENVLKLVQQTPCYDLKIDQYRRKKPKNGIIYPVHFHSNSVFHWLIKTGSGNRPVLHSLITNNLQTVLDTLKKHDKLIVICLQLKT
ncbi:uncharacterized protein LOC134817130 [Bolinopsis microptera]|uniref:uncharacterized protein LOC134817130 n=1 Tax=Bolinopsis microptera TaxID=2820187 RepID=UPI003079CC35